MKKTAIVLLSALLVTGTTLAAVDFPKKQGKHKSHKKTKVKKSKYFHDFQH